MSSFAEKLARGHFVVSLEITPPARWRPAVLARRASALGDRPDAVDVIQRAGRIPSIAAARWLARRGHQPIWHLVTRGRSRAQLIAEIERAGEAGLGLTLCLQGEGDLAQGVRVRDAVAELRRRLPTSWVGVSFDPYATREPSLRWLRAKLDAGARFVQTQPVFAIEVLDPLVAILARHHPDVALLPMLVPLISAPAARRLGQRLGIGLPDRLLTRLHDGGETAGWAVFEKTLGALACHERIAGATLMTFEIDPSAALLQRLGRAVDRQRPRSADRLRAAGR